MSESKALLEDLVAGRSSLTEVATALARLRVSSPTVAETLDAELEELAAGGQLTPEDLLQLRAKPVVPPPVADGTVLRPFSLPAGGVVRGASAPETGLPSGPPLSSWPGRHSAETAGPVVGVGTVLRDRFVIEEVLGHGGMGVVFKARDRRREEAQDRNPHVAIKVIGDDFKGHPDALVALQREARRMQLLSHPNIATVYDFDRDGEHVYLVMELLEGESLDHIIHRHQAVGLPKEEAIRLIAGAGSALKHAHSKGIVHSDFKPANVFLTKSGEVKIIDFGIARIAKDATPLDEAMKTRFDAGSLGAFTNAYASPEQMLDGAIPDPRDDIYALGLVAYELLTGRHPFDSKSAMEARFNDMKPAPVKSLSGPQNKALASALNFKREQRLGDAMELVQTLGGSMSEVTGGTAGHRSRTQGMATTPAAEPSPVRRRVQLSVTGIVLLIWFGLIGVYWWSRPSVEAKRERSPAASIDASRPGDSPESGAVISPPVDAARVEAATAPAPAVAKQTTAKQGGQPAAGLDRGAGDVAPSPSSAPVRKKAIPSAKSAVAAPATATADNGVAATDAATNGTANTDVPAPKSETLYRWVDKDNQVRFGPEPPPEYADTAVKIVDAD